jgi:CRISPR-associated endonuclease Cas2
MGYGPVRPLHYGGSKGASHRAMFEVFAALIGRARPMDALDTISRFGFTKPKKSRLSPHDRQRAYNTFNYLLGQKYIAYEQRGGSIVLTVTPQGRKRLEVKRFETMIDSLISAKPSVWDNRWRLILFDIPAAERAKRNTFRAFIRRIGAVMLQKSVWVYPHDCREQIDELKHFFDLSDDQLRIVIAVDIGSDAALRRHFKLSK